jgi:hypothetical protein
MAEADSRCSPDERSDFIAGALHRSTRGQAEIRSGEVSWRRPRQGRPSCRRKFSEADLFYSLGLAHADRARSSPDRTVQPERDHFLIFS